jgi:hypothetical protein
MNGRQYTDHGTSKAPIRNVRKVYPMTPTARTARYEIRLQGILEERWLRWFEGLMIDPQPDGETIIIGVMDQSALHGILNAIRDLGMELISVQRGDVPQENTPGLGQTVSDQDEKENIG